jgi:hypothetical protein
MAANQKKNLLCAGVCLRARGVPELFTHPNQPEGGGIPWGGEGPPDTPGEGVIGSLTHSATQGARGVREGRRTS